MKNVAESVPSISSSLDLKDLIALQQKAKLANIVLLQLHIVYTRKAVFAFKSWLCVVSVDLESRPKQKDSRKGVL